MLVARGSLVVEEDVFGNAKLIMRSDGTDSQLTYQVNSAIAIMDVDIDVSPQE